MHKISAGTAALAFVFGAAFMTHDAKADHVIPDDLIVQGSTCTGLDCVNNEDFDFDTLRLKENNLRIHFDDTSTLAGYPKNDWRIIANDSASGGAAKFSIEDSTGSKTPFTITAGAATNSMFVDSSGRLGLRTSSPVLDLHINTGNTPAHRLEQNASGGWGAHTWDIAGNEANFFVRDVTSGSKLPFRIRPGAPTSSIDISAIGNVGVGTASAANKLDVLRTDGAFEIGRFRNTGAVGANIQYVDNTGALIEIGSQNGKATIRTASIERLSIDSAGNVGIGTAAPATRLHTTGGVRFEGVANCGSGIQSNASGTLSCLASSRQFKTITGDLAPTTALTNIMALRPQTGSFKDTPGVPEHWFIAEEVAEIDPALVGLSEGRPYVVKTQNVVADLVAVVQQQQKQIEELRRLVAAK